jgi:phosphoserine phosphatase
VRLLGSLLNGAQIDFPASTAIGDSLTDVEILELAGYPFAFDPDAAVGEVAKNPRMACCQPVRLTGRGRPRPADKDRS